MALTGVWLNELNSIMTLVDRGDGTLTGKFRSLVGRDPHPQNLSGRVGDEEQSKQLLGFAVCFHIEEPAAGYGHASICTWSGWARGDRITTHWILTRGLLKAEDEWSSTLVGKDSFQRINDVPDEQQLMASREALAELLAKVRR
jgi:hypothetical protein